MRERRATRTVAGYSRSGGFVGERIGRDLAVAAEPTAGQLGRTLAALFLPGVGTGVGARPARLDVLVMAGVLLSALHVERHGGLRGALGRSRGAPAPARARADRRGGAARGGGTLIEQLEVWEAAGLDHLLLEDGGRIHSATLTALEAACSGTVTIVGRSERELLVRLGGDPACRRGALALGRLQ